MEKEFIPYDLALEMKQIGFNEPCIAFYFEKELTFHTHGIDPHFIFKKNSDLWCSCSAPTFSQCFRWFREKYELYHVIHHFEHKKDTPEEFLAEVDGILTMENDEIDKFSRHSTYEQAEQECLKQLIKIVKDGGKIQDN